jgi:hypothetical protein
VPDTRRGSASATCLAIPLFYKNEQMARRNTLIRIGVPELISPEHNDPADNKQHPLAIVNRKTGYTGVSYYLAHCSKFARPEVLHLRVEGSASGIRAVASARPGGGFVIQLTNSQKKRGAGPGGVRGRSLARKLLAISITMLEWDRQWTSSQLRTSADFDKVRICFSYC